MNCSRCGGAMQEVNEPLEKWGHAYFCSFCARIMRNYSNGWSDFSDICISEKPKPGFGASYDFIYGKIILIHYCEDVTETIIHEIIHHTLFKRIGLEACFKYDNISRFGEIENLYRSCE